MDAQAVAEERVVPDDAKNVDLSAFETGIDGEWAVVLQDRRDHEIDDPHAGTAVFAEPEERNETKLMDT
ncbi:hypothetical protein ACTXOR_10655 [Arthrobacter rhombi]|uniref:hypothetical protein n=1 Tax=Arthrobacter rhombi TaxID=71253 RepID=UPI003FD38AB4